MIGPTFGMRNDTAVPMATTPAAKNSAGRAPAVTAASRAWTHRRRRAGEPMLEESKLTPPARTPDTTRAFTSGGRSMALLMASTAWRTVRVVRRVPTTAMPSAEPDLAHRGVGAAGRSGPLGGHVGQHHVRELRDGEADAGAEQDEAGQERHGT